MSNLSQESQISTDMVSLAMGGRWTTQRVRRALKRMHACVKFGDRWVTYPDLLREKWPAAFLALAKRAEEKRLKLAREPEPSPARLDLMAAKQASHEAQMRAVKAELRELRSEIRKLKRRHRKPRQRSTETSVSEHQSASSTPPSV